jgi:hypothetical protein
MEACQGWGMEACGWGHPVPPPPQGGQQSAASPASSASCSQSVCSDFRQVIDSLCVCGYLSHANAIAEELEPLWVTMLLLRVPEDFGCYISLHSARSACRLTVLGHTYLRCQGPDGLVVLSCTSHPGVLGSIPKREEPGKTDVPCVKVPGSSRVPAPPWVYSRSPEGWWFCPAPATPSWEREREFVRNGGSERTY